MNNTITEELIKSKIKGETYTVLPSGKATVCELTLENGFSVRGDSAVVDKANFDKAIGEKVAYQSAVDKIWVLEGYLLQEKLYLKEKLDKQQG